MTTAGSGHCVCSIKKTDARNALRIAANARAMVELLERDGHPSRAEELERAFTTQLFIMGGKGSVPITIERKADDGSPVWLYSLEQGFYDFIIRRQWVVPVDGNVINRRITL